MVKLVVKKALLRTLHMLNAPLIVVHTTQAVSGTIAAYSGASLSVSVDVPAGYSVLAHVASWNTGVIGVLCLLDAYTTSTSVGLFQYNAGSATKNRGTAHLLTLCIKNT